jgi:hypothetical protein
MKPKDIFSLAIRLLGLFFIAVAAKSAPMIWMAAERDSVSVPAIITTAFFVAVAWWLLGGATILQHRAYPDDGKETKAPTP